MADDFTDEQWVYLGRRFSGAKVAHVFEDEDAKQLVFGKGPRLATVGGIYEVPVKRSDDGVSAHLKGARCFGKVQNRDEEVNEWRIEDQATETRRQAELTAKRFAKQSRDLSDITLGELHEVMKKQPSHIRRGTLAAVNEYLLRG